MDSTMKFFLAQINRVPWSIRITRRRSALVRALPIVGLALGAACIGALGVMLVPATRRIDLASDAKRMFGTNFLGKRIRRLGQTARKVLPHQVEERLRGNGETAEESEQASP